MNRRQQQELELTKRFFDAAGYSDAQLEVGDRPDIIATIGGRRIGIEQTNFHADERPNSSGSRMRAEEEQKAKLAIGGSYSAWGVSDPLDGLTTRIQDKVSRASKYDGTRYDALWLLISSQVPLAGAMASTFIVPHTLDITRLDAATNSILSSSPFETVHLNLLMSNITLSWTRERKWQAR